MSLRKYYKEYDNNLHDLRIELGYSLMELAERIGINYNSISRVASGYVSPFDKNGVAKPFVKPLCDLFNKTISEIWPYDICEIKVRSFVNPTDCGEIDPNDFIYDQLEDSFCGNYTRGGLQSDNIFLVEKLLAKLTDKERNCVWQRIALEEPLKDIETELGISRERVRQITSIALRKLRFAVIYLSKIKSVVRKPIKKCKHKSYGKRTQKRRLHNRP